MLVWERVVPSATDMNLSKFAATVAATAGGSYNLLCDRTVPESNWGMSTYTHSGASALLGVSAVVAGLAAALF